MSAQNESININQQLYHEWFPQIIYNHHQTGPTGTILFAPPFRDPANYVYHPLIITGLDVVGSAMHNRFVAENKPGATMRRGANYSTWWNGGLRTSPYFHNMIGLLTETIGNPTPMEVAFVPDRQMASADLPYPIEPQKWHFRQSIDYSITANWAVLDVASRNREIFLYNIYKMGKDSIDKGSKDTWTMYPRRLQAIKDEIAKSAEGRCRRSAHGGRRLRARTPCRSRNTRSWRKKPEWRDPRGYILPANQADFLTATKFVNALIKNGITVHRATAAFSAGGKQYPAGSWVVKTAQAFRPHVLDMFEPQDHPNDFQFPGGPPIPPYDNAGWTLAYQMGVKFDRILDGFDGPFEKVTGIAEAGGGQGHRGRRRGRLRGAAPPERRLHRRQSPAEGERGSVLRRRSQLAERRRHRRHLHHRQAHDQRDPRKGGCRSRLELHRRHRSGPRAPCTSSPSRASGCGTCTAARCRQAGRAGCSNSSSSTSSACSPQTLDAGNLKSKFDVIIFPDGGIPETAGGGGGGFGGGRQLDGG